MDVVLGDRIRGCDGGGRGRLDQLTLEVCSNPDGFRILSGFFPVNPLPCQPHAVVQTALPHRQVETEIK